jgi:hypothetical protein
MRVRLSIKLTEDQNESEAFNQTKSETGLEVTRVIHDDRKEAAGGGRNGGF